MDGEEDGEGEGEEEEEAGDLEIPHPYPVRLSSHCQVQDIGHPVIQEASCTFSVSQQSKCILLLFHSTLLDC